MCDGLLGADQLGDALPRPLDDAVRFLRFAIAAAAVGGADFALVVIDGFVDGFGLGPGGGGVVEVDAARMRHIANYTQIAVGTKLAEANR